MKSILLIGYGNTTRSDDGVGWYIADKIEEKLSGKIDVMKANQLTIEMAEDITERQLVIFADAHVSEKDDWIRQEEVIPDYRLGMTAHILIPSTLLAICEGLYKKYPKAWLFSAKGINFDFGEILSENTKSSADQIIAKIIDIAESETKP